NWAPKKAAPGPVTVPVHWPNAAELADAAASAKATKRPLLRVINRVPMQPPVRNSKSNLFNRNFSAESKAPKAPKVQPTAVSLRIPPLVPFRQHGVRQGVAATVRRNGRAACSGRVTLVTLNRLRSGHSWRSGLNKSWANGY